MDKYHPELVGLRETFSLHNGPGCRFWWAQSSVQAVWAEDAPFPSAHLYAHFLSEGQR